MAASIKRLQEILRQAGELPVNTPEKTWLLFGIFSILLVVSMAEFWMHETAAGADEEVCHEGATGPDELESHRRRRDAGFLRRQRGLHRAGRNQPKGLDC